MKKIGLFFITLLFVVLTTQAQKPKMRYGKVSKEEMEMKFCDFDSTASAVVLFDKGYSYFQYNDEFRLMFERHIRIKILKKEGYKYADFEVELYKAGLTTEELQLVKGKTYNIENGKIQAIRIKNSEILKEESSENLEKVKIAFSGVREGSVIELKYVIQSEFLFNLQEWNFQKDIPVLYSEYITLIPEYYNYNENNKGFENVNISIEKEVSQEEFTVHYKNYKNFGVIEKGTYTMKSQSRLTTRNTKNIPAFIEEPYLTTKNDYITQVNFEISSIKYPNQIAKYYTKTWESIYKNLLNSERFGKRISPSLKVKKLVKEICNIDDTPKQKLLKIYNYINSNIKCDKHYGKYTTRAELTVFAEKKGAIGDINILFVSLLKAAGINADPVILSMRANGKVFPFYPTISKFNYLIVQAKIGEETLYLDATNRKLPLGLIPKKCLNGDAWLISKEGSGKIKIIPLTNYETLSMYTLNIDTEEGISGKVNKTYKNYASYYKRAEIIKAGDSTSYIKELKEEAENEELTDIEIINMEDIYKPVKINYNISTSENINYAGNMIYLTPLLNEKTEDNPFKLEERKYPVDFAYPRKETVIIQYTIPEGYEVIETPKAVAYNLPGKDAQYTFAANVIGNKIQVVSNFSINKLIFHYDTYKGIKNFYNVVIKKQNEKIVLKKK